jgi:hypothetical protein
MLTKTAHRNTLDYVEQPKNRCPSRRRIRDTHLQVDIQVQVEDSKCITLSTQQYY